MTFDYSAIRAEADEKLRSASYNPKKLTLIYAGAALVVSLVITLLDLMLLEFIEGTGGLSGLGMRSVLETARQVLQYVLMLALPFWSFGMLRAALHMARGKDNSPITLVEGFRRFGSVLGVQLGKLVLTFAVGMVCVNIGSVLFYMTPMAANMLTLLEPLMTEGATPEQMQQALMALPTEQLMRAMWPALALSAVIGAALLIPLFYRIRLADFFVMDEPRMSAIVAMLASSRCMRRNRLKWFRLELGFWWYYLGVVVSSVLYYGDLVLPLLGVTLPMSSDAAWLLFYVLGAVAQFALEWQFCARVQTTYALAYDRLRQQTPLFPEQMQSSQPMNEDEQPQD